MAIVAPRLHFSILNSPPRLSRSMSAVDPPSTHKSHARTTERASSSTTMSTPLNSGPSNSFYPIATPFHTPQPQASYYSSALQSREKLREELVHESSRLTNLVQRLEGIQHEAFTHHGGNGGEMEVLWLEIYKVLFMIRSSLRRPSPSAVDDTIQHWSRYIYLFQTISRLNPQESLLSPLSPQSRGLHEDIPSTDGLNVITSDLFSSSIELGELIKEIQIGGNGEAVAHYADVTKEEDAQELVKFTVDQFGGVDVMVVNAGINIPITFISTSLEE
ncbi:hypothetical protein M422DRAFT_776813 [Sphaerobolus stellatus SS14]|nr:hypothetical protein M422DRAFT_776813 [Sphaerobolus stellatus SS14]